MSKSMESFFEKGVPFAKDAKDCRTNLCEEGRDDEEPIM